MTKGRYSARPVQPLQQVVELGKQLPGVLLGGGRAWRAGSRGRRRRAVLAVGRRSARSCNVWLARCRCGSGRVPGSARRADTSRDSARRSRGAAPLADSSSTSRRARARALPDGSARGREARRRGSTPARCAAPSATSNRRHIHAASRGSTPPGNRRRTSARLTKPSSAPTRFPRRSAPVLGSSHALRFEEPREVGRETGRDAPRERTHRDRLAIHQVVVRWVPRELQQAVAYLEQVREVTAREQSPGAGSGSADLRMPLPEAGQLREGRSGASVAWACVWMRKPGQPPVAARGIAAEQVSRAPHRPPRSTR